MGQKESRNQEESKGLRESKRVSEYQKVQSSSVQELKSKKKEFFTCLIQNPNFYSKPYSTAFTLANELSKRQST